MPLTLIVVMALHVLSAVFWAGSTFTLARTAGVLADRLFMPQMGVAAVAVISGGALCAVVAVGVQAVLIGPVWRELSGADAAAMTPVVRRAATAQRIAAVLSAVTVICMAVVRFV